MTGRFCVVVGCGCGCGRRSRRAEDARGLCVLFGERVALVGGQDALLLVDQAELDMLLLFELLLFFLLIAARTVQL